MARWSGIAAVGLADSSHCGSVGQYSQVAARIWMIGVALTHFDRIAAPHGEKLPFLDTNPISVAFPRGTGGESVCTDMAMTWIP